MHINTRMLRTVCFVLLFLLGTVTCFAEEVTSLEEKAREAEKMEEIRDEAARAKREAIQQAKRKALEKEKAKIEERIEEIDLPEDTTQRFTVSRLNITGNTLISTDELLKDMPLIYNASDEPLQEAQSAFLYDFRVLHDIILEPTEPRQVSARTIQGLTQYILSVYQDKNYGGIYVYVPAGVIEEGAELKDQVLVIEVLEAKVSSVAIQTYDPDQNVTEEGYLRRSAVEQWSPVKVGDVANKKELDDFVNLLNLNPDRYVSAVVSKGTEPESLALGYNVYEANPWHWFIQMDNSGTQERQWDPRIGLINTNLLGIDDTFTVIYQAPWDSTITENYGLYGSYDFPLAGPRLRLNLYAGHSEFDISPESGIFDFLGRGTFYGGILRYNLLQTDGWFLDVKGTLEHTRSKVNPSILTSELGTDIKFWLWGGGLELHRSDDMSNTTLALDRFESLSGCNRSSSSEFTLARTNAKPDFTIYSASAVHSQYLDPNEVNRLSGSFRWIRPDERLVSAKMTAFGGMYSVRGYDEYEFVADGGILASAQYEFDLVKYEQTKAGLETTGQQQGEEPLLRKFAPLAFIDYGRAKIKDHIRGTEKSQEEFISVGVGTIFELGDHFVGAVYYGHPLTATDNTRRGKGRVNIGLLLRW
jgi:hemolysin activation/secretion protein